MTPEQAAALRKPFPPGAIGKLPKPYKADSPRSQCRECHGYHGQPAVHLDYVGHAATTDRLLQVDPNWSWEPFALDQNGLPMLDGNRNLWIRMTVAGVTRIGVGDGKSLKECVGDAIRNSAMRFGVALDLWAKEDLHAADVERGTAPDAPPEAAAPAATRTMSRKPRATKPPETAPEPEVEGITKAQLTKLAILLGEAGMPDRPSRLEYVSEVLGHPVESSTTLSKAEGTRVIEVLIAAAQGPLGEPPEEPPWE